MVLVDSPGWRQGRAGSCRSSGWAFVGPWRQAWRRALLPWLAASACGTAAAALVTQAPDAGADSPTASAEAQADRPLTDLLPPGLLVPKAIDLLLDMHVDAVNLAYTPMEAAATAVMASGLDVRTLNPHVPANPMFPGYGLSYEPPPADGAGRQAAVVQASAEADGGPRTSGDSSAPATTVWQDGPRDSLADARDWIADHRLALLMGLGVAVVAGAALVAWRSRAAAAATAARRSSSRSESGRRRSSSAERADARGTR